MGRTTKKLPKSRDPKPIKLAPNVIKETTKEGPVTFADDRKPQHYSAHV